MYNNLNWLLVGMQTLERSYLLRINGKVVERPQHMLMRVSVGIHKEDIDSAIQTYHLLSERWFTHASPTLFNSGATILHKEAFSPLLVHALAMLLTLHMLASSRTSIDQTHYKTQLASSTQSL